MSAKSLLDSLLLSWFAKPKSYRAVYRALRQHGFTSIVELGINDLSTSRRLIRIAQQNAASDSIRYTGIDLFEARPSNGPSTTLKQAHRILAQTGAVVQLIPGEPHSALSRHANHLGGTQLMILTAELMAAQETAWFYVPRMLAPNAAVYLASHSANQAILTRVLPAEVNRRATTKVAA